MKDIDETRLDIKCVESGEYARVEVETQLAEMSQAGVLVPFPYCTVSSFV